MDLGKCIAITARRVVVSRAHWRPIIGIDVNLLLTDASIIEMYVDDKGFV